jgi:quercetin dioxygenase-like cupin family protein
MEFCINVGDVEGHVPEGHKDTVNRVLIDERMGIQGFALIYGEVLSGGGAGVHLHPFDQAFYVLSGQGKLKVGLKEYHVKAGTAYCAPAGVEHEVIALGPDPLRVLRIDSKKL